MKLLGRFWGCWKHERGTIISQCGYDKKRTDAKCDGCAENGRNDSRRVLDEMVGATAKSWAKRWGF